MKKKSGSHDSRTRAIGAGSSRPCLGIGTEAQWGNHALCRKFDVNADEFITKGMNLEDVQKAVLKQLEERNKPTEIVVELEEGEKFRAAAIDGLAMRAGIAVSKPAAGQNRLEAARCFAWHRKFMNEKRAYRHRNCRMKSCFVPLCPAGQGISRISWPMSEISR